MTVGALGCVATNPVLLGLEEHVDGAPLFGQELGLSGLLVDLRGLEWGTWTSGMGLVGWGLTWRSAISALIVSSRGCSGWEATSRP